MKFFFFFNYGLLLIHQQQYRLVSIINPMLYMLQLEGKYQGLFAYPSSQHAFL